MGNKPKPILKKDQKQKLPDYVKLDRGSGYVYLVKAQGFHGLLSPILGRYKIGLTNSPARRLKELNAQQAACEITGEISIKVEDNAAVEKWLHEKFKSNRKHGEWFDFWIWEIPFVEAAYEQAENPTKAKAKRLMIAGVLFLAIGMGFLSYNAIASLGDRPEKNDRVEESS